MASVSHRDPALQELDAQAQLTERVRRALRDAIVTGRLAPNSRLVQEQLAERLGVSRTPVREALHLLEREGLVQLIPRRGAVVHALTADDVLELYELRALLEPWAAARASRRARDDERERVASLAGATTRSADPAVCFARNRDFHRALCAACGNRQLLRALDAVWSQPGAYRLFTYQALGPGALARMASEHAAIADAFTRADADTLAVLVERHIRTAGADALERLRGAGDDEEA